MRLKIDGWAVADLAVQPDVHGAQRDGGAGDADHPGGAAAAARGAGARRAAPGPHAEPNPRPGPRFFLGRGPTAS